MNTESQANEQVKLHKIGIEHVELALRFIRERNSYIEYLDKSPGAEKNVQHTEMSVKWCNEQIKNILGI